MSDFRHNTCYMKYDISTCQLSVQNYVTHQTSETSFTLILTNDRIHSIWQWTVIKNAQSVHSN